MEAVPVAGTASRSNHAGRPALTSGLTDAGGSATGNGNLMLRLGTREPHAARSTQHAEGKGMAVMDRYLARRVSTGSM